jgi:D-alanyl-lipoteichoic acid acyltransferase DltB (MBOAT superfamily)
VLFNSIEFFIFFAIVYALYVLLPDVRWQNRMLLLSSYIFYGWWDVRFLYLVVLSTGLDYCCGLILGPGRIPRSDRLAVSACLLLAAVAFVVPHWDAIRLASPMSPGAAAAPGIWQAATPFGALEVDAGRLLTPDRLGWGVLFGTIVAVLVANAIYFPLVRLPESARRHVGLLLTVASNLVFLGFFKYFNFFVDSADRLLASLGSSAEAWHLHIILPAGISFYTFQSLSYTIDVYNRRTEAVRRLEDYALFVMFFPVLVAGPIERAGHMMPKLTRPRFLTVDQTTRGLYLILFGLVKKVAIADGLAPTVNSIYASTGATTWADVVLATLMFAFQIYCDFSGYTDIARGVGKVLGIDLLYNFNLPYFSRGPSEFWQRWHISLSSWLRDYLYIPLGGNRRGSGRTYVNLMITMVLGGLWHGAAWNFVLWGFYQGAVLCAYRILAPGSAISVPPTHPGPVPERGWRERPLASAASLALFFVLTCYGWLLFRASSLGQVLRYTGTLFADFGNLATAIKWPTLAALAGLIVLVLFEIAEYIAGSHTFYRSWPRPVRGAFYALLAFILVMGCSNEPAQFIYFQF